MPEPHESVAAELVDGRPVIPLEETIEFADDHYATFQSALEMLARMYEAADADNSQYSTNSRNIF